LIKTIVRYYEKPNPDLQKAVSMLRICSDEKVIEMIKKDGYEDVKEFHEEHKFLPQYFKKEQNTFK
jgi:hypothetical protein